MAKRLSNKEKGFVADYILGETGTQAALNNYDTESSKVAGVIAAENLAKPRIQQAIEEALPDHMLNEIHREGLFATKGIFIEGQKVDEDADFLVRAKYLDMAYKRKGSYAPEKSVNINLDGTSTERTKELGDRLIKLLRRGN